MYVSSRLSRAHLIDYQSFLKPFQSSDILRRPKDLKKNLPVDLFYQIFMAFLQNLDKKYRLHSRYFQYLQDVSRAHI